MSIITSSYRTYNARNFYDDLNANTSVNEYYIFSSSTDIVAGTNSEYSKNEFLEKTLFGKKIKPANVFFLIDNYKWILGTVYDQYDDKADLSDAKFYAIVYPTDNTTGDYRVYKCLFNNYGAPATEPPNYTEVDNDQIYRTSDGYVWKYMYVITPTEFEKYRTLSYLPVIGENNGDPVLDKSGINSIFVENVETNKGYEIRNGIIELVTGAGEILISSPNRDLSEISNFYLDQNLYVISLTNVGTLFTIESYSYDLVNAKGIIKIKENIDLLAQDSPIQKEYSFQIFPRIEILGDGTGAVAKPNFPLNNISGTITGIEILNPGEGYTNATARVISPVSGFDTLAAGSLDVEAILRPILSPRGGHGSNFAEELKSKRVLIYNTFSETENLVIPAINTYTKVGIVKNPEFTSNTSPDIFDNRLYLSLNSSTLVQDEIVTQSNSQSVITFSAQVHEVLQDGVKLCNYHGPYKNYPVTTETEEGYSDIPINLKSTIISSQGQNLVINKDEISGDYIVTRPSYVQKTGEVYYLTTFSPITRTSSSNEEYKIVLEF